MKNPYRAGQAFYERVKSAWALFPALREYFREPITLQHAEEQVKKNLATREERFLALVRSQVYERPGSPYLKLFKIAGCEFSDLQADVRRHGLEPNLNEEHLLRRLEEELSKGRWGNQFQTRIWRDAGTLRIKREAPHTSLRGKILPLHIDRSLR